MATWFLIISIRAYGSLASVPMETEKACLTAEKQWEHDYPYISPAYCINTATGDIK